MVSTLSCCNNKANYVGPSDPNTDSYSSDNSRVRSTRPTTRRNTLSRSPRALETDMAESSVDLIARGEQDGGQGGKTISYSQRAMETEMVESAVDLNARYGQNCGQGENTTLGTPRAMETKMIDSSEDLTIGNTTLRTQRAMETGMVDSSGDLIAENTTSCTTPRAMEMELVETVVGLIAEHRQGHGQGDKTTLSVSKAMETEMVGLSADLMARHKPVFGKGENRTSHAPRAVKNKKAETSVESIAKRRRVRGRGVNKALYTPTAMETEMMQSSVNLTARRGQGRGQGNTSLCSARVVETELMESGGALTVGNTTLYTPRAMEVEMVRGHGRRGRGHRQGGYGGKRGTRRVMQGTWSHPIQKRVRKGEQNKEISNPGPSSVMEKVPSSPEGQAANMKKSSCSAEGESSCKKTILSWLIDCNIVKKDEQVCYKDGTMERITGRITRGGILCSCCQQETSVWTFEKHAGSDLRQPYEHIYIRKNKSLRQCQKDAWRCTRGQTCRRMFSYVPKKTAADQNDDACSVCGDGGDLICCDKCPSTYHLSCMNIERVPQNDWLCPYCVCKYCGLVVDLVVEKKECFEKKEGFKCSQCDKKCHWECFEEVEKEFSKEPVDLNPSRSYCGPGCREIYKKLDVSLGIRNDYSAKYSWKVIRRTDKTTKKDFADTNLNSENNSRVAVTWMLMSEAFKTLTDTHTGINVIQSIVYSRGSNLNRIDFSRFYMFVLEKDDEIIAAASIRFHGGGIAEMPFIATEMEHWGQGVCQELMRVIESFLRDLKVTKLIIPSVPATSDMWKSKFNFTEVSEKLMREISSYKILMFPGTLRLYKDLSASIADGGDDIEDDKTDIKNDLEPQMEQAEATARIEHGPSSGRLAEVKE